MSFSRCLAVPSVAASGGFSLPSVYLARVLFRNEIECRATESPACAYLHLGGVPHVLKLWEPRLLRGPVSQAGAGKSRLSAHLYVEAVLPTGWWVVKSVHRRPLVPGRDSS